MNRLFTSIYIDEDVDVLIADLLKARGFETVTTQQAGGIGNTDSNQLRFAIQKKMTLLTHNRVDFEKLAKEYFENNDDHYGIIIASRHNPREIAKRLFLLLNDLTADEMKNQLCYI